MTPAGTLLVLEDDPTGTQLSAGVPFVLDLRHDAVLEAGEATGARAVHLLTNSRAHDRAGAENVVCQWAQAGLRAFPRAAVLLRGDSTLRGWPLEEVNGLRRALRSSRPPILLLAPAFPQAGRITRNGRHYLRQEGALIEIARTEYAADPVFGFHNSDLLEWAAERSGGYFDPRYGARVDLAALRENGGEGLLRVLHVLAESGSPAVCAPDIETESDLALVADGWLRAQQEGLPVFARGSPALATVAGGSAASDCISPRRRSGPVLVVVGSHVGLASDQLRHLQRSVQQRPIELDVASLLADDRQQTARLVATISERLRGGLAIIATPRHVEPVHREIEVAATLALRIAGVVQALEPKPGTIITKGGITSAVIARDGLGASWARVLGPVLPGVGLWQPEGGDWPCLQAVAPGNIGGQDLLTEVVERMTTDPILV